MFFEQHPSGNIFICNRETAKLYTIKEETYETFNEPVRFIRGRNR